MNSRDLEPGLQATTTSAAETTTSEGPTGGSNGSLPATAYSTAASLTAVPCRNALAAAVPPPYQSNGATHSALFRRACSVPTDSASAASNSVIPTIVLTKNANQARYVRCYTFFILFEKSYFWDRLVYNIWNILLDSVDTIHVPNPFVFATKMEKQFQSGKKWNKGFWNQS